MLTAIYTLILIINDQLESMFMKHYAPNHMLVHNADFKQEKGHLKF